LGNVFISYRRGDQGWAGRLNETLERKFDGFFDAGIEPGDDWQERLEEELADCRVFLLVVGPEWVKEPNLRRLGEEDDWVRKEVTAALEMGDRVRIVPLLVGSAAWPAAELLPAELGDLGRFQQLALPQDPRWAGGVADLVGKLNVWLAGRPSGGGKAEEFPPVLPYLCDRVDQEDDVVELVDKAGSDRVLACVLHGERAEGHNEFLDRLRYRRVFEDLFGARGSGVAFPDPLEWTVERAKLGDFAAILRRAIKRRVLQRVTASDEDLRGLLRAPGRPTILVLEVTWSDYRDCGSKLLSGFVDGWFSLFRDPPVTPQQPLLLWINFTYPNDAEGLDLGGLPGVLRRLPPIREHDIQQWTRERDVNRYVAGREAAMAALADDPDWSLGDGSLHMLEFADAVKEVLSQKKGNAWITRGKSTTSREKAPPPIQPRPAPITPPPTGPMPGS